MDISIFLAKFWGWYLLIFFLILSFNTNRIKQIFENLKDQKFLIITSFVAIIIGLLNILFHNIWEPSWKFIITAIGWVALSKGLALFIFPVATTKWLELINIKLVQVLYILLFLTGILLLNISYQLVPY
ncbi:hypothetical protein SAMN04487910_1625 [Aquimarina amphilecti]|uniref:Integral membrane protein (PIN domain superfamily) n=1 Tax=Aquimarina amphilecti TaxID=1038014 RepID=A0A1H7M892_AQUAM|nr:hypothetical protein [Aquimarina amphilecti]SEL07148.1 hypothetical protein SAMN04487910_1625 [Aquimarina amphilecti]